MYIYFLADILEHPCKSPLKTGPSQATLHRSLRVCRVRTVLFHAWDYFQGRTEVGYFCVDRIKSSEQLPVKVKNIDFQGCQNVIFLS